MVTVKHQSIELAEMAATYFIDDICKQVHNGKLVGAVFKDLL